MVKNWYYLAFIILFIGCLRVPSNKLKYLNNANSNNNKPMLNGCYYSISDAKSNSGDKTKWIEYFVFYNSGLIRYGSYRENVSSSIENDVKLLLKKFKEQSSNWGDYRVVGDSIYIERISRVGMAPYEIYYETGFINSDSSIRILNNYSTNGSILDVKNYKFLPFRTMPDSTGYLYDKIQKNR